MLPANKKRSGYRGNTTPALTERFALRADHYVVQGLVRRSGFQKTHGLLWPSSLRHVFLDRTLPVISTYSSGDLVSGKGVQTAKVLLLPRSQVPQFLVCLLGGSDPGGPAPGTVLVCLRDRVRRTRSLSSRVRAWVYRPNRGRSDTISRGERETGPALIADRPGGHPRGSSQRVQARPTSPSLPRGNKARYQPVSSNPGHFRRSFFFLSPVFLRTQVVGTTSGEWECLPPHYTANIPEAKLTGEARMASFLVRCR